MPQTYILLRRRLLLVNTNKVPRAMISLISATMSTVRSLIRSLKWTKTRSGNFQAALFWASWIKQSQPSRAWLLHCMMHIPVLPGSSLTGCSSKAKNLTELSHLGHFLKGSSATLGFTKVKDECEKIQRKPSSSLCLLPPSRLMNSYRLWQQERRDRYSRRAR